MRRRIHASFNNGASALPDYDGTLSFQRINTLLPLADIALRSATFSIHRSSAWLAHLAAPRCIIRTTILRFTSFSRSSSARAAVSSSTASTHLSSA